MISFIIGLIGAFIALIGWFGCHSLFALLIGTILYVIETIMQLKELNPNALSFELSIFVIGCIIFVFLKKPFYIGGMIAINIYSALISLIGFPSFVEQLISFIKFMRK